VKKTDAFRKTSYVFAFSAIIIFSIFIGARSVNLASANGIIPPPINQIYIRSNGTIEPSTAPILKNGDVYTLTESLRDYCIIVERDNIMLNGAGHQIQWSGYDRLYHGVTISHRTKVTIKNMNIKNFLIGINLDRASNNTIIGNTMSAFTGVTLGKADYNQIIGNTVTEGYGINGEGSNNLIISNHFSKGFSDWGMGISLSGSSKNNTISHNTITHELSISLTRVQYNTISNNTIIGGSTGIVLGESSNNLIFGNILKRNTGSRDGALDLTSGSFGNIVLANQFEDNVLAVSLGDAPIGTTVWNNVYDNTFSHNNFVNNVQNIYVADGAPVNFWDDGEEGNYWSDYNGTDADGDGVGNNPYSMDANNKDNHPLMKPVNLRIADPTPTKISIISPEKTTYAANDVSLTVAVDKFASWMGYSLDGQTYATFSENNTLTGLSEGAHNVTFYVSYSGKEYSSSATFAIDTTCPLISILHPETKSYLSTESLLNVSLNFTVDESVSQLAYSLDGKSNVTVGGNITLALLPVGAHNVTVYAWDAVGNVGVSKIVIFTIAEPEPEPSLIETFQIILVAAPVTTVTAVGIGLLVYFKKRKH
jgi:parallel beta-helix repeat protein